MKTYSVIEKNIYTFIKKEKGFLTEKDLFEENIYTPALLLRRLIIKYCFPSFCVWFFFVSGVFPFRCLFVCCDCLSAMFVLLAVFVCQLCLSVYSVCLLAVFVCQLCLFAVVVCLVCLSVTSVWLFFVLGVFPFRCLFVCCVCLQSLFFGSVYLLAVFVCLSVVSVCLQYLFASSVMFVGLQCLFESSVCQLAVFVCQQYLFVFSLQKYYCERKEDLVPLFVIVCSVEQKPVQFHLTSKFIFKFCSNIS